MKTIEYAAIGDSLTAGYGVTTDHSFVSQYAGLLQEKLCLKVNTHNFGVNGATSKEIMEYAMGTNRIRNTLQQAHVITITAGGNDLIQGAKKYVASDSYWPLHRALVSVRKHLGKLLKWIDELKQHESGLYTVLLLELYNPVPDMEDTRYFIGQFNQIIHSFRSESVQIVELEQAFETREESLLGSDYVHPNEAGYLLMAQAAASQRLRV